MRQHSFIATNVVIIFLAIALFHISDEYITRIAVRLPLDGTVADPGAPWPVPQEWTPSTTQLTLDAATFEFASNFPGCDIISKAFERYRKWINLDASATEDDQLFKLGGLVATVTDGMSCDGRYPAFGDNETYTLTINSSGSRATLNAATVWGILRGLETFSQLIYLTEDKKYVINATSITDYPRYSHRGLHLDTARHYYPVNTILKFLDTMSWDKFNVFHWHIVDDQSFPYVSTTFPNISQMGAYSPYHIYSQENVTTIINEARLRGIRVVAEFDTPGHTWSWGRAFPDLITPCWGEGLEGGPNVPNYPIHGPKEIINPMTEYTYTFMQQLYEEIVDRFPDGFVHLGMDEVYYACWQSNPNMTEWMSARNMTQYNQVQQYYAERLIQIVENLPRKPKYIIWQDPIENNVTVNKDTIVEVWKDVSSGSQFRRWQDYTLDIAMKGYNMILSAPWYLNMISYGQDWKNYYLVEPSNFTDDAELQNLVKGGEACTWSEYIDSSNVFSVIWPRASAIAERLWSSKNETDVESAKFRLDQQRCRMVRRGVPAKPILPGFCGDYEWDFPPVDDVPSINVPSKAGKNQGFLQKVFRF